MAVSTRTCTFIAYVVMRLQLSMFTSFLKTLSQFLAPLYLPQHAEGEAEKDFFSHSANSKPSWEGETLVSPHPKILLFKKLSQNQFFRVLDEPSTLKFSTFRGWKSIKAFFCKFSNRKR